MISCKEHLTKDGLDKLVAIKSSMNKGLPAELKKTAFSHVEPISRPGENNKYILNPNWLAGFISVSINLGLSDELKDSLSKHYYSN